MKIEIALPGENDAAIRSIRLKIHHRDILSGWRLNSIKFQFKIEVIGNREIGTRQQVYDYIESTSAIDSMT